MKPGAPAGADGTAVATKALPSSSSFVNASVDGVCVCVLNKMRAIMCLFYRVVTMLICYLLNFSVLSSKD